MNAAHKLLREATAPHHAKVDAAFGAYDLSDPVQYIRFLRAQAGAYIAVESALDRSGAAALVDDWPQRRRADALLADLHVLGSEAPSPLPAPPLDSEAALWGALYVLEGSRLGGRTLAPMVAPGAPRQFLDHQPERGAWRKLLDRLDQRLVNDDDRRVATSTAQAVFDLFEASARTAERV